MNHRNLRPFLFACLIGLVSIPSLSHGQEWARNMFKVRVHKFGDVQLGDVPECRFEFENLYNEDIHIASVHSSCGCTIATASKNLLSTNETAEIICRFNTPAVGRGFKQATITVRFDRPSIAECQLTVSGNIVTGVSVSPASIDFGQVTENNFPEKTIKISHSGSPGFRIHDVKSSFGHISVQVRETARRGGFVSYDLTTQLKESAPHGYNQGELYVIVEENPRRRGPDNAPIYRRVAVKFNAKVVSALQITPEILTFGAVEPGEESTQKVFLTSERPFKIKDVRCHSDAFHVKSDNGDAKKMHIVEIGYKGEDDLGHHECELSFFVEYTDIGSVAQDDEVASGTMKAIVEVVAAK